MEEAGTLEYNVIDIKTVVCTRLSRNTEQRMTSSGETTLAQERDAEGFLENIICELVLKDLYAITGGDRRSGMYTGTELRKNLAGWRNQLLGAFGG